MKKFCILPLVAALAVFVSCQKQQSEEEKRAEIERQVQERLAAEHQADEKQRLAQQQADLEAREKKLAEKEAAAAAAPKEKPTEVPQPVRRIRDTAETRSPASYGMFYRKLEPYGAWRETSDYGYVWQPREAEESRDWRPYAEGRWAYTDAGWTWVSDEPFGWATFHYGRWVRLRRVGWVWVPGDEWAPAWVSWRTSKDYVGWAPLPPEARFDRKRGIRNWADNYYDIGPDQYAFVPNDEFGARRIQQALVPVERNITIVIDTTNVTSITFTNTTIFNQGPNYEEMRTRSRQPIERYRLEREERSDATSPATVRGDVLVMSAPALTTVPGVDRPQTIKETMTQTTVEKNWSPNADRVALDRARAKMKAEVTPPPDAPLKTVVQPEPSATFSAAPNTTPAIPPFVTPTQKAEPEKVASPMPAPTVHTTAPKSTPTELTSPSVHPRQLTPFLKPSPSREVLPKESAKTISTPEPSPEVKIPSETPDHPRQSPSRRLPPIPTNTPPVSPQLPDVSKPKPRDLSPKNLVPPRVRQPLPPTTPSMIGSAPDAPMDSKPAIPPAPPAVRSNPPASAHETPGSHSESSPAAGDKDREHKKQSHSEKVEEEKVTPVPKN